AADMYEVEVKARVPSAQAARDRLLELGAERLGKEEQRDTYFAHPQRDFAATDEALRLREAWGRAELTYKGPKLDAQTKTREELTARVEPSEELVAMLQRLGFRPVAVVAKWRETWKLRGAEVAVDEVEGLGAFVEVELGAHTQPEAATLSVRALALLRELGGGESLRTSYLEMLLGQGKG
ncbi:MAG TPA: class IV adenylate cyclase, partial [Candidatus Thermoplasmatota archaeon]|nr:class IV adenylate cyclase [Candidatus Thermoplasmatota archaeon]